MTGKRSTVPAALCVAALGALTGCTVPVAGVAGIAVSEDGRPLGVMLVCHHRIDGATLHDADDGDDGDDGDEREDPPDLGRWSRGKAATGFTLWSLESGGRGWSTEVPASVPFSPRRTYRLYGWTRDNSWSASAVSFTGAQFAALEPGQVRYYKGEGMPGSDRDGYATVPFATFRASACTGV
ncbi:hypothetical protein PV392_16755 [Streptomyces sp. ME03-5709C]|nr:hypothetical protein [Streptomyces sp. ME03-5709C]